VPSDAIGPVDTSCGVFVSSSAGSDDNVGSQDKPWQTLQYAIDHAKGKPIYACNETFSEAIAVGGPITMYGALDCTNNWIYTPEKKSTVSAKPNASGDTVALSMIQTAKNVSFFDFAFQSQSALAASSSSIAVLANGSVATFTRCDLTAGNGAVGVAGASETMMLMAPATGANGGDACTSMTLVTGGTTNINDCGGGDISTGGKGGDGELLSGGNADDGQSGTQGTGGKGQPMTDPTKQWSCAVGMGANFGGGQTGSNGADGNPGAGAKGPGTLTAIGYAGNAGGDGTPGHSGQGGGGGAGVKGGNAICMGASGAGASGGAGGAGGCGGKPGLGGKPGGASIALVSAAAKITLVDCTLISGLGGDGGAGGDLQAGASGGQAGGGGVGKGGAPDGCNGGKGGQGGNGGPGGGGLGGPSLGIAFTNVAPVQMGNTVIMKGTPGNGGKGGSSNMANNAGADGSGADMLSFGGP
jgi:hypothetical protein